MSQNKNLHEMMDNLLERLINLKAGEKMRELTMNERKKLVNILHKRYIRASHCVILYPFCGHT